MCGIAGYIDSSISTFVLEQMQQKMIHRGPDDVGYFINNKIGMTMRRLSIIDIDNGKQPFFEKNKNIVVFQNGEIYNYKELRNELKKKYKFITDCDTEVLSHGYVEWGITGLLEKLDGMFAIAIFDNEKNELYIARDPFGEKPLFYTLTNQKFSYASDMRCFQALDWADFSLSEESIQYYLLLHYVPGDMTIFSNIKRVLPGELLTINLSTQAITKFKYYQPTLKENVYSDPKHLLSLIEKSVITRLHADVPVGIFLSGGLDSSLLTAISSKVNPNISTFSVGFESNYHDESKYAKAVAAQYKTNHNHFTFNENSFLDLLPKVARSLDEPIGDQALLPVYWLSQEAKKYVKVVLSGEGSDEIFGGYSYYEKFVKEVEGKKTLRSLVNFKAGMTLSGFPLVAGLVAVSSLFKRKISSITSKFDQDLVTYLDTSTNELQRATLGDMLTWLPDDLLVKFDRMTMAHSLEGRAPYLQKDIVNYGISCRAADKIDGQTFKKILCQASNKVLPVDIINRKKQGFVLPMDHWVKSWLESFNLKEYVNTIDFPYFDKSYLNLMLVSERISSTPNPRFYFSLIMLLEWYRYFFNKG
jgi:asparagine synthase (glutamine-hydrolysing)